MKTTAKFIGIITALFLIVSCGKNQGTGTMTVKMKDQPIAFDNVYVEVLRVEVHHSNDNQGDDGWITLDTEAGIYDLLTLQDGVLATLAEEETLPVGQVNQMRLILGSSNSVVVDSVAFPLLLSSQDKTGLKFNLNATINEGDEVQVIFDFDAEKSIVIDGSGQYRLKPVIKVESVIYE